MDYSTTSLASDADLFMTDHDEPTDLKSSADSKGQFAPHGEFTLRSDGEILCYEATGPFNLESMQALRITRIKAYERWQPTRKFAAVVHWHNSALMSPEAFHAYRDGYIQFIQDTQAEAVVAWAADADVEGMYLMVQKFAEVFALTRTNFRFFTDIAPAHAWVRENLDQLKSGPPS